MIFSYILFLPFYINFFFQLFPITSRIEFLTFSIFISSSLPHLFHVPLQGERKSLFTSCYIAFGMGHTTNSKMNAIFWQIFCTSSNWFVNLPNILCCFFLKLLLIDQRRVMLIYCVLSFIFFLLHLSEYQMYIMIILIEIDHWCAILNQVHKKIHFDCISIFIYLNDTPSGQ